MKIAMVHVEGHDREPTLRHLLRRPVGDLAEDLAARGHEVRELGLFLDAGAQGDHRLGERTWSIHSAARTLSTALTGSSCDAVHGVGELGGRITERALAGARWVWSYDAADTDGGTLWWPRTARVLVAPSEPVAQQLLLAGAPEGRIRILPERFLVDVGPVAARRTPDSARLVTTVLDDDGGTADVVRALTLVPGAQLVVLVDRAGWGSPERRRVQLLAHGLHVEDRLSWRVPLDREELQRVLTGSDMLVHVPREHLDQRLVVSALGAGVPVVVSDVADADGLVVNGLTGLRVSAGDPRRLAMALAILGDDPRMREDLVTAGRRHVRDTLDRDAVIDALLPEYAGPGSATGPGRRLVTV